MKPIPPGVLMALVLGLCGLCVWQWQRESQLRKLTVKQAEEIAVLTKSVAEANNRILAADAEILRLTGTLSELRANSIPLSEQEELKTAAAELKAAFEKQNELITRQNEALEQANSSVLESNQIIQKLTAERDSAAKRLNEITLKYNKLANP